MSHHKFLRNLLGIAPKQVIAAPQSPSIHGKKEPSQPMNKIENIPLADLIPYARNSRTHSDAQVAQIAGSIREFGFTNPVLIDATGTIIAGHGRVLAARKLSMQAVPCLRLGHLTPAQVRAYVIADNRMALSAGWDEEMLRAEIAGLKADGFDVGQIGFTDEEIAALLAPLANEGQTDPDDVPEVPKDAVSVLGDVWILGAHRITCGDGTSPDWIKCKTPGLAVFDPPWDADCAKSPPSVLAAATVAFTDCQRIANVVTLLGPPAWVFVWDCVSSWYTPNRPLKRGKLALWYGDIKSYNAEGAHYGEPGEAKTVTNSRGTYAYKPNPNGKHLSDVFQRPITAAHSKGDEASHSHSKPADWVRMIFANCSEGSIVDPFSGSGTSIIVAEMLGRSCESCELSPTYVDVAVRRWQKFTGKPATLESTGEAFDAIAAKRAK